MYSHSIPKHIGKPIEDSSYLCIISNNNIYYSHIPTIPIPPTLFWASFHISLDIPYLCIIHNLPIYYHL